MTSAAHSASPSLVDSGSVLITGAGRGIGRGLALAYLDSGWEVTVTVRREVDANELTAAGARALMLDVTEHRCIEVLQGTVTAPVDLVINNAGVLGPTRQSALDMDFDAFGTVLAVNTIGPLRVTQAVLPRLLEGRRPRLVNISSRMGSLSYAKADSVAYRASKSALNKITQCLATDLAGRVVVVAVHPGWVRTAIGGDGADITVDESVGGLTRLLDRLTPQDSGRFLDYRGAMLDW